MLKTSLGPFLLLFFFFPFTPYCILQYFQCFALEIRQNPSHVIGNRRLRCHSGCITAFDFLWPSPIETIHSCKIAIFHLIVKHIHVLENASILTCCCFLESVCLFWNCWDSNIVSGSVIFVLFTTFKCMRWTIID